MNYFGGRIAALALVQEKHYNRYKQLEVDLPALDPRIQEARNVAVDATFDIVDLRKQQLAWRAKSTTA